MYTLVGFEKAHIHVGSTRGISVYLIKYVSVVSVCYCKILGFGLSSSYNILNDQIDCDGLSK